MNVTQKLIILNKAAQQLREAMSSLVELYKDEPDITYHLWKINKQISVMHQAICVNLEVQTTQEQFDDIIKDIKGDGNDG
jgi:CHASE3 domain sensor protein